MSYFAANGRISQEPIEDGIEISEAQYADALTGMLEGKEVSIHEGFLRIAFPREEVDEEPLEESSVTVLYPADLYRRATDEETESIEDALSSQPLRIRRIFEKAQTYRSDDELWPLLRSAAVGLFGEERADTLLAPSDPS